MATGVVWGRVVVEILRELSSSSTLINEATIIHVIRRKAPNRHNQVVPVPNSKLAWSGCLRTKSSQPPSRVDRTSASVAVDWGLIPSRFKLMIIKLVFTAFLLDAQH